MTTEPVHYRGCIIFNLENYILRTKSGNILQVKLLITIQKEAHALRFQIIYSFDYP